MHGVTQTVRFPAIITSDATATSAKTEFVINRKDFGIVYPGKPDEHRQLGSRSQCHSGCRCGEKVPAIEFEVHSSLSSCENRCLGLPSAVSVRQTQSNAPCVATGACRKARTQPLHQSMLIPVASAVGNCFGTNFRGGRSGVTDVTRPI